MTTTDTRPRVTRRALLIAGAVLVLVVAAVFAVRWGIGEARVADCIAKVGVPGAITEQSVEDVCRGVPGAHLQLEDD